MRKQWFLITMIFLVVPWLMVGCGVAQEKYDRVQSTLVSTQASLEQTTGELETTKSLLAQTTFDLEVTKTSLEQTQSILTEREVENNGLENRVDQLGQDLSRSADTLDEWRHKYEIANTNFAEALAIAEELLGLTEGLTDTNAELQGELGTALTPPYASISARELSLVFYLLDGSIENWTLPIDIYRNWIQRPEPTDTVTLNTVNGPVVLVDFTKFVRPSTFENVVTDVYENSMDEWEFAKEAFNITTQLTVYSADIGEDPRWPVETFVEGGGDCEDLSILYATILKASPYPYEVELVYMDSDNPTDPQTINHVMVSVATDDWRILSETTNDDGFDYYERVIGWYFNVET